MRELRLTNLQEFLSRPLWDTHTMIFRGVSKSAYDLKPSIARVPAKNTESLLQFEQEIFEEFQSRALPYLKHEPKTKIEWLYLAQHYGIPTRLLDWTTNPLIALYFASNQSHDADFAVYKKIQHEWLTSNDDPFQINKIYGLRPKHTDIRYINQAGLFTIHPPYAQSENNTSIGKYIFPANCREEIKWQLGKYGIKTSFIYPNLDGISKDILEECKTSLNGGSMRSTNPLDWM
jgi:hypothetical protein